MSSIYKKENLQAVILQVSSLVLKEKQQWFCCLWRKCSSDGWRIHVLSSQWTQIIPIKFNKRWMHVLGGFRLSPSYLMISFAAYTAWMKNSWREILPMFPFSRCNGGDQVRNLWGCGRSKRHNSSHLCTVVWDYPKFHMCHGIQTGRAG